MRPKARNKLPFWSDETPRFAAAFVSFTAVGRSAKAAFETLDLTPALLR